LTLLNDIQSAGGIDKFQQDPESNQSLSFLLDERVDLYGGRGDPLCRRISNKVARWKKLSEDQWFELLMKHKSTDYKKPASKTPTKEENTPRKEASRPQAHCNVAKPTAVPTEITTTSLSPSASKKAATMQSTPTTRKWCSSWGCSLLFVVRLLTTCGFLSARALACRSTQTSRSATLLSPFTKSLTLTVPKMDPSTKDVT
jgi:hypothetical protein